MNTSEQQQTNDAPARWLPTTAEVLRMGLRIFTEWYIYEAFDRIGLTMPVTQAGKAFPEVVAECKAMAHKMYEYALKEQRQPRRPKN